ncbi:MAG: ABC transporter permease subunit, partial [Acidimicrobiia bacterium]
IGSALLASLAVLLAGQTLARFAVISGTWFSDTFGGLAFLGDFVTTNGEILAAIFSVLAALAAGGAFALLGSRLGYVMAQHTSKSTTGVLGIVAAALAGAILAVGFGRVVAWLYQIVDTRTTVMIPAIVGAALGALVGWLGLRRGNVGAGIGVYYVARTVYNTLRSIEPLIMAIVFVIWVGLGPFAGSFALGLHTVAGLAKLYSEQVESINPGPVEAVRATGATRLQTVVYGVVPQIVAPYISFTMYRWDINVRMSTIIGFVGGGGIGFILQQNISLLNYRAAAAQMLAIAIVVATMDYVSSRLRERFT